MFFKKREKDKKEKNVYFVDNINPNFEVNVPSPEEIKKSRQKQLAEQPDHHGRFQQQLQLLCVRDFQREPKPAAQFHRGRRPIDQLLPVGSRLDFRRDHRFGRQRKRAFPERSLARVARFHGHVRRHLGETSLPATSKLILETTSNRIKGSVTKEGAGRNTALASSTTGDVYFSICDNC